MNTKRKRRRPSRRTEFFKALLVVILIGLVLRIFVVLPYRIPDRDMEKSLYNGDFLLVSQLAYRSDPPKVGDIVVFEHPIKVGSTKTGRVIAVEGQTVQIENKTVLVNGRTVDEAGYCRHDDYRILPPDYSIRDNYGPFQVPAGSVFVLGDNRDYAEDSRHFGAVSNANIQGRGILVYWSWKPDPNAPRWESPYIVPAIEIFFYNTLHFPSRIGWDRIGVSAR